MSRVRVPKKKHSDGSCEYYENLRIDTRTNYYWWDEMIDGRHYRKSTGEKTVKKALSKIKYFRKNSGDIERAKIVDAIDLTVELQSSKSNRTHVIAQQGSRRFKEFINCKTIIDGKEQKNNSNNKITYLDQFEKNYELFWNNYKKFAHKRNIEKFGVKGDLTHDRKFFVMVLGRAKNNKWIDRKFTAKDFKIDFYDPDHGRALDDWEVNRLLETLFKDEIKRKKQVREDLVLLVLMGVLSGFRKEEAIGISIDEICLRKNEYDLDPERIKTRSKRKMNPPIPLDIKPHLLRRIKEVKKAKGKYLFPGYNNDKTLNYNKARVDFSKAWDTLVKESGVECTYKDLRSTCITNMIAKQVPESTIAAYLGNSKEEIKRAYDKVHGSLRQKVSNLFDGEFYTGEEDDV